MAALLRSYWIIPLATLVAGCVHADVKTQAPYPPSPRGEVVDTYYGQQVADPYRWLEDNQSPETRAWVEAQQSFTERWLSDAPGRDALRARVDALSTYERWSAPSHEARRYTWWYNDGTREQPALYVSDDVAGQGRVLLDATSLSADGTVSVAAAEVSPDGQKLAWASSDGGSDWITWRVRDINTGVDLPDVLEWSKFGGAEWSPDSSGFYYRRYAPPDNKLSAVTQAPRLFFHTLGTPPEQDRLVYERPDQPDLSFGILCTDDGAYDLLYVTRGTNPRNQVHFRARGDVEAPFTPLFDQEDASWWFIGNHGSVFYFITSKDAPRRRIVTVDVAGDRAVKTVVPEGQDALQYALLAGGRLFTQRLVKAFSQLDVYALDGTHERVVPLPAPGEVDDLTGRLAEDELFFRFSTFTSPPQVLRYRVGEAAPTVWRAPQVPYDPSTFVTEQVFYPSDDGQQVSMFLVRAATTRPDGKTPTLLYGYGGFNISMTPSYSAEYQTWMELGGLVAVANLRGGSEYGEAWHEAGMRKNKQQVFDDFIAAGEYLIRSGWTRSDRLAIKGGSNGGLLVGAVLNQRPELWGAALPMVGVMDMLRYDQFTIGHAWRGEYGSSTDPDMFPTLLAYSPYHNIKQGVRYPATMVTTADHDDRVVPAHSYKYTAALQHAQGGGAPILIRIETRAGHSSGMARSQKIDLSADTLTFLTRTFEMDVTQLAGATAK